MSLHPGILAAAAAIICAMLLTIVLVVATIVCRHVIESCKVCSGSLSIYFVSVYFVGNESSTGVIQTKASVAWIGHHQLVQNMNILLLLLLLLLLNFLLPVYRLSLHSMQTSCRYQVLMTWYPST